ncbi:hypothetical protein SLS64_011972 [Diaporthe eres]
MATFTFLVVFSVFLLQVAGEAFPTIILQQNDGVFPNVTNSTGTLSIVSPSGTSFITVNVPQEAKQVVADQVKRYNDAGEPINNDEILPGYSKEKRQHNTCHLICTPSSLADICQGSPVFASCADDCELNFVPPVTPPGGNGVGPLQGSNTEPHDDAMEDQITCISHCSCAGGNGEQVIDRRSNEDNPFQGLD